MRGRDREGGQANPGCLRTLRIAKRARLSALTTSRWTKNDTSDRRERRNGVRATTAFSNIRKVVSGKLRPHRGGRSDSAKRAKLALAGRLKKGSIGISWVQQLKEPAIMRSGGITTSFCSSLSRRDSKNERALSLTKDPPSDPRDEGRHLIDYVSYVLLDSPWCIDPYVKRPGSNPV